MPGDMAGGLFGETVMLKVYFVLGCVTTTRAGETEVDCATGPMEVGRLRGG